MLLLLLLLLLMMMSFFIVYAQRFHVAVKFCFFFKAWQLCCVAQFFRFPKTKLFYIFPIALSSQNLSHDGFSPYPPLWCLRGCLLPNPTQGEGLLVTSFTNEQKIFHILQIISCLPSDSINGTQTPNLYLLLELGIGLLSRCKMTKTHIHTLTPQ